VITDEAGLENLLPLLPTLPHLRSVLLVPASPPSDVDTARVESVPTSSSSSVEIKSFYAQLAKGKREFNRVLTKADDPALLIYTSGKLHC
jgi:acyl-coenzyme A synthetase/AMP-(fatty) acid ligase